MDARIATQQSNLTAQLNAANQTLQAIPMQLNMIDEIYSAITGYKPEGVLNAMRHYHQAAIESANGVQLIVALYDGLQRFLTQAAVACEVRDQAARREAARRALNIIIHLQANLRMDAGGASAERLSDFYTAVFADVLRASATYRASSFSTPRGKCATSARPGISRHRIRQRSACSRPISGPHRSSAQTRLPFAHRQMTTTRLQPGSREAGRPGNGAFWRCAPWDSLPLVTHIECPSCFERTADSLSERMIRHVAERLVARTASPHRATASSSSSNCFS